MLDARFIGTQIWTCIIALFQPTLDLQVQFAFVYCYSAYDLQSSVFGLSLFDISNFRSSASTLSVSHWQVISFKTIV